MKRKEPFRVCYQELGKVRAQLPNVPLVTLTATATSQARTTIMQDLCMFDCSFVIEDADRINIRYSVSTISDIENAFEWLVNKLKKDKAELPKVLVFCQSKTQCTFLYELFSHELGNEQYFDPMKPNDDRNSLIGMYHHGTRTEQKETAEEAFTNYDSTMRVLFCTSSFGTGVDVKGCYTCIHLGPPHLLDEYLQQTGRLGRDMKPSSAILLLFKQCTAGGGFEDDCMAYIKNTQLCRRMTLLTAIENPRITSLAIPHTCCDICANQCKCLCSCDQENCQCKEKCLDQSQYLSEAEQQLMSVSMKKHKITDNKKSYCNITECDRQDFKEKLLTF